MFGDDFFLFFSVSISLFLWIKGCSRFTNKWSCKKTCMIFISVICMQPDQPTVLASAMYGVGQVSPTRSRRVILVRLGRCQGPGSLGRQRSSWEMKSLGLWPHLMPHSNVCILLKKRFSFWKHALCVDLSIFGLSFWKKNSRFKAQQVFWKHPLVEMKYLLKINFLTYPMSYNCNQWNKNKIEFEFVLQLFSFSCEYKVYNYPVLIKYCSRLHSPYWRRLLMQ